MSLRLTAIALSFIGLAAACSGNALFSDNSGVDDGGAGGSTSDGGSTSTSNGGSPSSSSNGGSPSSSSNGGSPSSSSNGGAGGTMTSTSVSQSSSAMQSSVQSSSSTGGMMMCAHDPCVTGVSLADNCDPCVTQICAADQFCCSVNGTWDEICQSAVFSVCGLDCNPTLDTCDMQYGGVGGYYTCVNGIDQCVFGHNTNTNGSCGSYCAANGGECDTAYNNQGQCGFGQQLGCQTVGFQSLLCVCSRGCGMGPACSNGQTCVNGNCQ
jgi:hypothetical protein